jgi:hypothetical protein
MTIIEAMSDPKLFAKHFANVASWSRWRVFLAAVFGLPMMTEADLEVFRHHTGRTHAPTRPASEVWAELLGGGVESPD